MCLCSSGRLTQIYSLTQSQQDVTARFKQLADEKLLKNASITEKKNEIIFIPRGFQGQSWTTLAICNTDRHQLII